MQSTVRWSRVCVNISSTAELVPCDGWNGQTSLTSVQLKPTEQREALLAYTLHLHLHHTAEEESSLEHLSRTRTSTPHTSNHHTNDPQDRALSPDLTQTRQQVTRIWFQVKHRPYNDVCFEDYLGCFALFCTSPKSRCGECGETALRKKERPHSTCHIYDLIASHPSVLYRYVSICLFIKHTFPANVRLNCYNIALI